MRRIMILALLVLLPPRMGLLDSLLGGIDREGDDEECIYCEYPRRAHIRNGGQLICPDQLDP